MLPTILSASFGDPSAFALGLIRYTLKYNSNFYVRYQKVKIRVIKSTELIDTLRDK